MNFMFEWQEKYLASERCPKIAEDFRGSPEDVSIQQRI